MKVDPSLAFLCSAYLRGVFASIGPVADLPIVNKILSPDGFQRSTVLAGGTFPGPNIKGHNGDTFRINVIDLLADTSMDVATSVHWHGIDQHKCNAYDGAAFSFEYTFGVHDQAGTFWYHSHFSNQYCGGLRGPLIVYDLNDPFAHLYDVDDDTTVIMLADWYHYLSHDAPAVPAFNSTLIKGLGQYAGGPPSALSIVNVEQGKRYCFRLVSISCYPNFTFTIDNHQMTIIEVDGSNVQPLLVDQIRIFAAQRYSVIVTANRPVGNYWIRSLPNVPGASTDDGINAAILRYKGASTVDPSTIQTGGSLPLVESNRLIRSLPEASALKLLILQPGEQIPGGADININLTVLLNAARTQFLVNNVTFQPPTALLPSDLLHKGSIYGLQPNKSVEIVIPGGVLGCPHPLHLHGHSFHVVLVAGKSSYNFDDPGLRDTVNTGAAGEVTIRFSTDNPGPWFIHRHIDLHLSAAFAAVMAEDVGEVPGVGWTSGKTHAWGQLWPAYNQFVGR
ncbi:laccase [Artomyces pyxidatus]|uniref:Laccase n=1 Tax=Artomyces pyxidatus TaxID=48021 RepID=A0ACB8SPU2_9AGAM|nr:laccase [Artomyces pyxidatus]